VDNHTSDESEPDTVDDEVIADDTELRAARIANTMRAALSSTRAPLGSASIWRRG
jgi:hypothetical protein